MAHHYEKSEYIRREKSSHWRKWRKTKVKDFPVAMVKTRRQWSSLHNSEKKEKKTFTSQTIKCVSRNKVIFRYAKTQKWPFVKTYRRVYFRKTQLNQERTQHWSPRRENPKQEKEHDKSKSQNNSTVVVKETAVQMGVKPTEARERNSSEGRGDMEPITCLRFFEWKKKKTKRLIMWHKLLQHLKKNMNNRPVANLMKKKKEVVISSG